MKWLRFGFVLVLAIAAGCARRAVGGGPDVVFVVPGVSGDGPSYNSLLGALVDAQLGRVQVVRWGAPAPLFFMNFSTKSIHDKAEAQLARRIEAWLAENAGARIDLIGHSAGCGVILGALSRLPDSVSVNTVILLAPSVSPGYELQPSLRHISGTLHSFVSERDTLFLKWRSGNFGTYDRVKTPAAGNLGFDVSSLPPDLAVRVVQHRNDPGWKSLGNDGGHFGTLSKRFVVAMIIPLLDTSRSSAASRP